MKLHQLNANSTSVFYTAVILKRGTLFQTKNREKHGIYVCQTGITKSNWHWWWENKPTWKTNMKSELILLT